nr:adipose-regulatory protein, seipin [Tanacetum cinerariifolium]
IGKVLLWMCYSGVVAVRLMVLAFVVSGMVMRLVVEEPVMATVSLTLPELDYNRNLEFS